LGKGHLIEAAVQDIFLLVVLAIADVSGSGLRETHRARAGLEARRRAAQAADMQIVGANLRMLS